jgi:hypothetical protein
LYYDVFCCLALLLCLPESKCLIGRNLLVSRSFRLVLSSMFKVCGGGLDTCELATTGISCEGGGSRIRCTAPSASPSFARCVSTAACGSEEDGGSQLCSVIGLVLRLFVGSQIPLQGNAAKSDDDTDSVAIVPAVPVLQQRPRGAAGQFKEDSTQVNNGSQFS